MNVFFDTNILLDVALRREPHYHRSQAVLTDAIANHGCFLSWHTISNISYILGKLEGRDATLSFIRNLSKVCRVAPVVPDDLGKAFEYDGGDFEDAMQVVCAIACKADVIVTRDPAGFTNSPIPVSAL